MTTLRNVNISQFVEIHLSSYDDWGWSRSEAVKLVNDFWGHSAIRCCKNLDFSWCVCFDSAFVWILLLGVQIKVWQGSSNLFLIELANIQSNNNWNSGTSIQGKKNFHEGRQECQNGGENHLKYSTILWAELTTSAVHWHNRWCSEFCYGEFVKSR